MEKKWRLPRKYITHNVFSFAEVIKLHNGFSIRANKNAYSVISLDFYKCELCIMKTINPAIDPYVLTSFVNHIIVN